MADPSRNPFEQPYPTNPTSASAEPNSAYPQPSHASTSAAVAAEPSTTSSPPSHANLISSTNSSSFQALPQLIIPQDESPHDGSESQAAAQDPKPTGSTVNSKKVKWPAELSSHISIRMASPTSAKTLQDQGARDELTRALEEHSRKYGDDVPFPARFIGPSGSEVPSRATSSDGDPEERFEEMREQMDVYIDPGETDGLPSVKGIGRKSDEKRNEKQAWNLVRGATMGSFGFRQRKNAGFKSGMGLNKDDENHAGAEVKGDAEKNPEKAAEEGQNELSKTKSQESATSPTTGRLKGFFSNLLEVEEDPADLPRPSGTLNNNAGGGILSALIALQQQQQQQGTSGVDSNPTSGFTTPTSEAPSRASLASDEDDDEELERIKFTLKQREKRAKRSMMQDASSAISHAGKSASHALGFGHGHSHGGRASHGRNSSGEQTPAVMAKKHNLSVPPNSTSMPGTPGHDDSSHKRRSGNFSDTMSGLFNRVTNLEDSASRPEAARSGGGVFAGLMLSANQIAGAASPAATTLAPNTARPGYHLSRYSAPHVPTTPKKDSSAHADDSPKSTTGTSTLNNTPPLGSPPLQDPKKSTSPPAKKPAFSLGDLTPHRFPFSHYSSSRPSSRPNSRPGSTHGSPHSEGQSDYFPYSKETEEERERREWEKEKRRRRKLKEKRKQQEVFITQHVAAILERQQFILKLARAFMMFGAPSHRLEAQLQATARVLEINAQVIYIPAVMLVSFGDTATHTSEVRFIRQASGLDLGKLKASYMVYYNVIYDKISVTEASKELDVLMLAPPQYALWQNLIIGGLASAFIQPSAFYGSFIDCLVSIPLGALLVLVQVLVSRNDLYSSLFEIVIATINAFLAAALASTKQFCFASVASGSVVLILPGYIVLCGSLELANRSIISGSVRLVYSILYSLFLGFGLSMGSEVYQRITGLDITGATDYTCSTLRLDAPWYRATISPYFYFLTIPGYLCLLALRNGQPLLRRDTITMVAFGSAGFCANYFSGKAFVGRSDVVSAIGSFTVGFLGNLYGKFSKTSAFIMILPGILLQLPSGLSNGGLLEFAADSSSNDTSVSSTSYSSGFSVASSLIEVAIGLTVGLFLSAAIVSSFGGGRRRGANLSSF